MSLQGLQVGIFLASGLLLMLLGVVIFQESPGRRLNRVTAAMLFFGGLGVRLFPHGSRYDGLTRVGRRSAHLAAEPA